MPPHCDTLDGPVVTAARRALEAGNVNLILPWVPETAEDELRRAFARATAVRALGGEAADLADLWLFETAVRLHRQGEGAPYTGLKPAGLDPGPVVPRAEHALQHESPEELVDFLLRDIGDVLREKYHRAVHRKRHDEDEVGAARAYIGAMLEFTLFSHHLYEFVHGGGVHGEAAGGHEHHGHAERAA